MSGRQVYGNSYIKEPAMEFSAIHKLYSLLISLLNFVDRVHVDYFDFFKGPSNSMELLNFFKEALNKVLAAHTFDCERN